MTEIIVKIKYFKYILGPVLIKIIKNNMYFAIFVLKLLEEP